jgi:uncharacterized protein (TIGR00645 family)
MMRQKIEHTLEKGLFASRWLVAPFYIGLVFALLILLVSFMNELCHYLVNLSELTPNRAILATLSLIDLSLAANLLLIVIFSGYENFVSKLDLGNHVDRPEWMGTVDFSALKLKLVASMVAISGIHLLKVFMDVDEIPERQTYWMITIHMVFVISGVLLALTDFIAAKAKSYKKK